MLVTSPLLVLGGIAGKIAKLSSKLLVAPQSILERSTIALVQEYSSLDGNGGFFAFQFHLH